MTRSLVSAAALHPERFGVSVENGVLFVRPLTANVSDGTMITVTFDDGTERAFHMPGFDCPEPYPVRIALE